MREIRTTLQPGTTQLVSEQEYVDLSRMGLVLEDHVNREPVVNTDRVSVVSTDDESHSNTRTTKK